MLNKSNSIKPWPWSSISYSGLEYVTSRIYCQTTVPLVACSEDSTKVRVQGLRFGISSSQATLNNVNLNVVLFLVPALIVRILGSEALSVPFKALKFIWAE